MSNREVIGEAILPFFIGIGTGAVAGDALQLLLDWPENIPGKYLSGLMVVIWFVIWGKRK